MRRRGKLLVGLLLSHGFAVIVPCLLLAQNAATEGLILSGHLSDVTAAEFTADGRYVITSSTDETARLWDAQTGQQLQAFRGHTGPLYCLAISTDGSLLATGAQDNTLRLWDIPRPTAIRSLAAHQGPAEHVAISADGMSAVSVGQDKTVRLISLASAQAAMRTGHAAPTTRAAFRSDNSLFATADEQGSIFLWSPYLEQPQGKLGAHQGAVTGLYFHPNNQQLLSAGADGTFKLWQLPTLPRIFTGSTDAVRALAIANGQLAVIGGADKIVRIVDFTTGQQVREIPGHEVSIGAVAVSPNLALIASGDESGKIRISQFADGVLQTQLIGHAGPILSLSFHPDNQRLLSSSADGTVRVWQIPPPPVALAGHAQPPRHALASGDGQFFVTASDDLSLRVWNAAGQGLRAIAGHSQPITALALRSDNSLSASGDASGQVQFSNPQDGTIQSSIGAHTSAIAALSFHPAGQMLWTAAADGTVKQWQLPITPPRPLNGHSQAIRDIATSSEGTTIATAAGDLTVRLWRAENGEPLRTLDAQLAPPTSVAFSRDNALVVSAGDNGTMLAWKAADGSLAWRLSSHGGAIADVAIDAMNQRLITAHADNHLRLWRMPGENPTSTLPGDKLPTQAWAVSRDGARIALGADIGGKPTIVIRDLASGTTIAALTGHEGPIAAIAFSNDGSKLISGSADRTARVWNLAAAPFPELVRFTTHPTTVTSVALSADGTSGFSSAGENVIHQWNTTDGAELRMLSGHAGPVVALQTSAAPGTNVMYSASADGTLRSWNAADGAPLLANNHGAALVSFALAPDGQLIMTAGADRVLKIWNAAGGLLNTVPPLDNAITAVALSSDSKRLAAMIANEVRSWSIDGKPLERIDVSGSLSGLAFVPQSPDLITCTNEAVVRKFPAHALAAFSTGATAARRVAFAAAGDEVFFDADQQPLQSLDVNTGMLKRSFAGGPPTWYSVSADGHWLACSQANNVALWDLSSAPVAQQIPPLASISQAATVRAVAFDATAARLAAWCDDQSVHVWDVSTRRELERFAAQPASGPLALASPQQIVIALNDNSARAIPIHATRLDVVSDQPILDLDAIGDQALVVPANAVQPIVIGPAGTMPRTLGAIANPLTRMMVAGDLRHLAASDAQGRIALWSIADPAAASAQALLDLSAQVPTTLIEVGSPIADFGFSADGALLAVGAQNGKIHLYRTRDGRLVEQLGAGDSLADVSLANDGRTIVALSLPAGPQLLRFGVLHSLEVHGTGAVVAAFSPNGEQILTGGADQMLQLWNTADAKPLRSFSGPTGAVTCVGFAPDNSRVFAGSADRAVRVWNTADAALLATWNLPAEAVALHISSDGQRAALATGDHTVRLWDVMSAQELEWFDGHEAAVAAVRIAPDNRTVLSAAADKSLRIAPISALRATKVHEGAVLYLAPLSGGGQAVTSGADGALKMWDVGSGQMAREFQVAAGVVQTLAVRSDNQRLAAGGADGQVHLWNLGNGEQLTTFNLAAPVVSLAFSPDNQKLAAANANGQLVIYGPATPPMNIELVEHQRLSGTAAVTQLVFTSDNRFLYSSDASGQIQQWAYASPTAIRQFGHGGSVFGTAFSSDAATVVSSSADQTVRVFDVKTGGQRAQLNGHQGAVYGLAISRDNALCVSSGADNTLRLWDVLGGRQLKQLASTEGTMYGVSMHPMASIVAAGGGDRKVHLFDVLSGTLQRSLEGHKDFVQSVSFNPQGTRILSYGYAGTLIIWNAADGAQLYSSRIGRVGNTARYSPDGKRLVVATGDGLARIIDVPAQAQ